MIGRWHCSRAETLLDEGKERSTVADRIWLEEHLEHCDDCRTYARRMRGLRHLVDEVSGEVTEELARRRMIARALEAQGSDTPRSDPARTRPMARVAAVSVVAVLAASALLVWSRTVPQETAPNAVASTGSLTLSAGERAVFGHAEIEVSREAQLRWEAPTLHVERGALSVAVDPNAGRPFRVRLPGFLVEVVGTRFEVDERGVHVHEGRVRILDVETLAVEVTLGPGDRYQHEALAMAPVAHGGDGPPGLGDRGGDEPGDSAEEPTREADPIVGENTSSETAHLPDVTRASASGDDDEPIAARLARARAALARGAVDRAEAVATDALRGGPRRTEAAEARTILAEAALVGGDLERSARLHLAVARAYPDLVAGETALFAAARLYTRAGMNSQGSALFVEYLERHPNGRFAAQARRRVTNEP